MNKIKILQTLSRLYINDLNSTLEFYEKLLGTSAVMRFKIPKIGLELAQIENILLIAGSVIEYVEHSKAD